MGLFWQVNLNTQEKDILIQITLVWRKQFELPWWQQDWHHNHWHHFLWGRRRAESWTYAG